jgi:hypothetical protein
MGYCGGCGGLRCGICRNLYINQTLSQSMIGQNINIILGPNGNILRNTTIVFFLGHQTTFGDDKTFGEESRPTCSMVSRIS